MPRNSPAYADDLAYIHDSGFGQLAENAATVVGDFLAAAGKRSATVVDLGCGSGILAAALSTAGHRVVGFDISAGMLRLARRRAPHARFRRQSFLTAPLPRCDVVTAIGEVLNYQFDRQNTSARLVALFQRVYHALRPGGLFLFDVAEPGRAGPSPRRQHFIEGKDWVCLVTVEEDRGKNLLTRRISSFRQVDAVYRRSEEVHRLRLCRRWEVRGALRLAGFRVKGVASYAACPFPTGLAGFWARKP